MPQDVTANLHVGLTSEKQLVVEPRDTAPRWESGKVEVLATPRLVALFESAACCAVDALLPEGWLTVGTQVDIEHVSPTPVGMAVSAHAELLSIAGRRLEFRVIAHDQSGVIGRGTHQRVVLPKSRFLARVAQKLEGSTSD